MLRIRLKEGERARYGCFFLSEPLVEEIGLPVVIEDIFAKCFIVRCEYMYEALGWRYTAFCMDFEPKKEGEMIPEYSIQITDGRLSFVPF